MSQMKLDRSQSIVYKEFNQIAENTVELEREKKHSKLELVLRHGIIHL